MITPQSTGCLTAHFGPLQVLDHVQEMRSGKVLTVTISLAGGGSVEVRGAPIVNAGAMASGRKLLVACTLSADYISAALLLFFSPPLMLIIVNHRRPFRFRCSARSPPGPTVSRLTESRP